MCLILTGLVPAPRPPAAPAVESLTGNVFDGFTGRPVRGAFVILVDREDREVARTLTDSAGGFRLGDGEGPGWLRVERVGFTGERYPEPVAPGGGPYRVAVTGARVLLEPSVAGTAQCTADPTGESPIGIRWREVRKALSAVRWTGNRSGLEFSALEYDRRLAASGLVLQEAAENTAAPGPPPVSALAPAQVDSLGFVALTRTGQPRFAAPTPDILLASGFTATHCFAVSDPGPEPGLVGLEFRPTGDAVRSGLFGTFWLDAGGAELRSVDFSYEGAPALPGVAAVTGRLALTRLVTGEWVVREWERTELEDGGEQHRVGGVLTGLTVGGEVRYDDQRLTLVNGTVFDSTTGGPLPGAVVTLAGTGVWTTTDADGAFFLTGLFDGRYDVLFGHPRLDSLGFISPRLAVALRPRETMTVALVVPPLNRIVASRCPGPATPLHRVVFGVVHDPAGRPTPGADVTASWQTLPRDLQAFAVDDRDATAVTDTLGTYTLCGVSVGRRVVVHARDGDRLSAFVSVVFDGDTVRVGQGRGALADRPVARLDLTLAGARGRDAAVRGTVTEAGSGKPIDGVEVLVGGTDISTTTDGQGHFELRGLPAGTHRLTARRVGYRRVRHELELAPGETREVSEAALAMPGGAVELAPIIVEAEAVPAGARHLVTSGFLDRRDQGFGRFVTRDEFETWHPTQTTDVIRRTGGIRVTPNPAYGYSGDARKYLIGSSRSVPLGASECPALFFVDGVYFGSAGDPSAYIDTMLAVGIIEAIEIYNGPSETPPRFNRPGAQCGVIVFWTR